MRARAIISVLINNHNYGQFIGEAIESVLNQTYQDFELIIVDGDSSDTSRDVILSYLKKAPDKITAVLKPTSGQGAAFNVGFAMSRGDIICFLDADDYFYPEKLEKIAKWHETYDFIGHGRKFYNGSGELKTAINPIPAYEDQPMLLHKYGYFYSYNLMTSNISMRRELAEKIFPMPEDYITFADCYVMMMSQYYGNIKYMPEALNYYRIHKKQACSKYTDAEKCAAYTDGLVLKGLKDVNNVLAKRGQPLIPQLTEDNLSRALQIANPHLCLEGKRVAIYGLGSNSYRICHCVDALHGAITCAIDSNPDKWGTTWNDLPVVSLEEATRESKFDFIVIGSNIYGREIAEVLKAHGLRENEEFAEFVSHAG